MKKKALFLALLLNVSLWAYEFDLPEESSACSLSMRINLDTLGSQDQSGRASLEIRLINKSGNPLPGYGIQLNSTGGTFICEQSGKKSDNDDGRSCFTTGPDGIARVRLVSIPVNFPIKIKATCDCGDYQVFASGNLSVKQNVIRKKRK